jgi:hypothetical protein
MKEKFLELLKKKAMSGDRLKPKEKEAKMSVLDEIEDILSQANASKLNKLSDAKKVTVSADSPEGLLEGLEKAEEVVEASSGEMEDEEYDDMEEEDDMGECKDEKCDHMGGCGSSEKMKKLKMLESSMK